MGVSLILVAQSTMKHISVNIWGVRHVLPCLSEEDWKILLLHSIDALQSLFID